MNILPGDSADAYAKEITWDHKEPWRTERFGFALHNDWNIDDKRAFDYLRVNDDHYVPIFAPEPEGSVAALRQQHRRNETFQHAHGKLLAPAEKDLRFTLDTIKTQIEENRDQDLWQLIHYNVDGFPELVILERPQPGTAKQQTVIFDNKQNLITISYDSDELQFSTENAEEASAIEHIMLNVSINQTESRSCDVIFEEATESIMQHAIKAGKTFKAFGSSDDAQREVVQGCNGEALKYFKQLQKPGYKVAEKIKAKTDHQAVIQNFQHKQAPIFEKPGQYRLDYIGMQRNMGSQANNEASVAALLLTRGNKDIFKQPKRKGEVDKVWMNRKKLQEYAD